MSAQQGRRSIVNMVIVLALGLLLAGTVYSIYAMTTFTLSGAS